MNKEITPVTLATESFEFLYREHEQLWLEIRHMYGYLLKVYALYVAALGATFAATITLLSEAAKRQSSGMLASPLELPTVFVLPVIILLVTLGATLMFHVVKFRTVAIEYTDALNAVRRAFHDHDTAVQPYLKLPKEPFAVDRWWNADFFSYASVAFFSACLLGSLAWFMSIRVGTPVTCGGFVGVLLGILWGAWWAWLWKRNVPKRGQGSTVCKSPALPHGTSAA